MGVHLEDQYAIVWASTAFLVRFPDRNGNYQWGVRPDEGLSVYMRSDFKSIQQAADILIGPSTNPSHVRSYMVTTVGILFESNFVPVYDAGSLVWDGRLGRYVIAPPGHVSIYGNPLRFNAQLGGIGLMFWGPYPMP
jgi:hypothetical protein